MTEYKSESFTIHYCIGRLYFHVSSSPTGIRDLIDIRITLDEPDSGKEIYNDKNWRTDQIVSRLIERPVEGVFSLDDKVDLPEIVQLNKRKTDLIKFFRNILEGKPNAQL